MNFIFQILILYLALNINIVSESTISYKLELFSSGGAYIDALPNKTIQNLAPGDQIVGRIKKTRIKENGAIVEKEVEIVKTSNGLKLRLKKLDNWQQIKNNIANRIVGKQGWTLKYTDNEIEEIISHGQGLGLPDSEIEDIVLNGCRPDKNFTKTDLISQCDFWCIVKKRGFPNLFESLEDYEQFSGVIKQLAQEWNLPINSIYTQGSSLRISNISEIGDLDIAIKVNATTFDNLVARFKAAADNQTSINRIGSNGKIGGIDMFQSSGINGSFTGNFYPKFQTSFGQSFQSKLGVSSIQISIVKEGSSIDVSPYLKLK